MSRDRERELERPPEVRSEPRALTPTQSRQVRSWIKDSELELRPEEFASKSDRGPKPTSVSDPDSRFKEDLAVVRGIQGLSKDEWARANIWERAEAVIAMERSLADAHGRKEHRVYALPVVMDSRGDKVEAAMKIWKRDDWFRQDKVQDSRHWTETDDIHVRDLGRHSILLSRKALQSDDPRAAFEAMAEECRHAYQSAVLRADPSQFPEVDAKTREMWQYGTSLNQSHPELYNANPREVDAKRYATELTRRRYEEDHSPT